MTPELDLGYHIIAEDALDDYGAFDDRMSIVEFFRRLTRMEELSYDVAVYGLDDYLRGAEDSQAATEYIHDLLRERVNYILNQNPRVQFIVDEVENWDGPVIPDDDGRIALNDIFHGSLDQEGPGWYHSHLNVQS